MTDRIQEAFKKGKVFAAYVTAGDGPLEKQLTVIRALLAGGVNMLEIGIPFSDPIADGPVIQRAMQRSLAAHTTIDDVLHLVEAIRRETDVPVVLFTYCNPIMSRKHDILRRAKAAGVDGVLVIDLPFFDAKEHLEDCAALGLDPIAVVSPSTSEGRLKTLVTQGKGFLYYVCQKGTTGVRAGLPSDLEENVKAIKKITALPVIVGFGIADRASSQAALAVADGFVVGSYFIDAVERGVTPKELTALAVSLS